MCRHFWLSPPCGLGKLKRLTVPVRTGATAMMETRATLFRWTLPQTGAYARYRREWLGRIVDPYRNTGAASS